MLHELAGRSIPKGMLCNIPRLISQYYLGQPDPREPRQRVAFGTSGHRGSALELSFNEAHVLAIIQAICNYRRGHDIGGPLFLGQDTHALSEAAHSSAIEVLAANAVPTYIAQGGEFTPTPVLSHALIGYNRNPSRGLADGVLLTPSHNPPADGGIKYNCPHGGPAGPEVSAWIAAEANRILAGRNREVKRLNLARARCSSLIQEYDYRTPYIADLENVIDMEAIRSSGLRLGADALGGSGLGYWLPLAEHYGLDLTLLHGEYDPAFSFMPLDHDGKVRMDCSSPQAMGGLVKLKHSYDIAFGNDPDFDRHGIVTPSQGLLNPNHFLAVAVDYLFTRRRSWPGSLAIGKTIVSSTMLDAVAAALPRPLLEVPVGFKWFVPGLAAGTLGFAGEESAGASFLRRDGRTWTTDKDGFIMSLLAAEITAVTGRDPGLAYRTLEERHGRRWYARQDRPCGVEQKQALSALSPEAITVQEIAGRPILAKQVTAPGNQAAIGGLKVITGAGWFAIRPSGTENISKIYAESAQSAAHLKELLVAAEQFLLSL